MYLWTFENMITRRALTVRAATFEDAKQRAAANGFVYDCRPRAIVDDNRARDFFKYFIDCGEYNMYLPTIKAARAYAKKHNGKIYH